MLPYHAPGSTIIPSVVSLLTSFVGDILTSAVRPTQDTAFILCFIVTGTFTRIDTLPENETGTCTCDSVQRVYFPSDIGVAVVVSILPMHEPVSNLLAS